MISVNVKGTYCGPIGQKIDKSIGKTPILGVPNDPLKAGDTRSDFRGVLGQDCNFFVKVFNLLLALLGQQ